MSMSQSSVIQAQHDIENAEGLRKMVVAALSGMFEDVTIPPSPPVHGLWTFSRLCKELLSGLKYFTQEKLYKLQH